MTKGNPSAGPINATAPFYIPYIEFTYPSATNLFVLPVRGTVSNYPENYQDLVQVRVFAESDTCSASNQVGTFSLRQLVNGGSLNYSSLASTSATMNLYFLAHANVNGRTYSTPCAHIGHFSYDVSAPTLPTVSAPAAVNTPTAVITFSNIHSEVEVIAQYTSASCTTRVPGAPVIQVKGPRPVVEIQHRVRRRSQFESRWK
jgi:hypothetical protein